MKNLFFVAACLSAVCLVNAAEKKELTQEEKAAMRAAAEKRIMEKSGGRLMLPGKGKVAIINCGGAYDTDRFLSIIDQVDDNLHINVETADLKDRKFTLVDAKKIMEECGGNVAVFIVDDPALPLSLHAPETGWALMNVAALRADKAEEGLVKIRARKMFARVLSLALGSPFSPNPASPMQTVTGLASLDKMPVDRLNVFDFNNMIDGLGKFGVTQRRQTTYKRACVEGWAPAPTNTFQKAIWDAYHEVPSKGIEIKYDPKKGE